MDNPKQRKNRPTYNTVHTASNSPNMETPKETNMSHPKKDPIRELHKLSHTCLLISTNDKPNLNYKSMTQSI